MAHPAIHRADTRRRARDLRTIARHAATPEVAALLRRYASEIEAARRPRLTRWAARLDGLWSEARQALAFERTLV